MPWSWDCGKSWDCANAALLLLELNDALLSELVENQHRVDLPHRTDLDDRSQVPAAVDTRQEESLVGAEIHGTDLLDRFHEFGDLGRDDPLFLQLSENQRLGAFERASHPGILRIEVRCRL